MTRLAHQGCCRSARLIELGCLRPTEASSLSNPTNTPNPHLHSLNPPPRPPPNPQQIWQPPAAAGGRGKQVFLGSYDEAADAAQAYDRCARQWGGGRVVGALIGIGLGLGTGVRVVHAQCR